MIFFFRQFRNFFGPFPAFRHSHAHCLTIFRGSYPLILTLSLAIHLPHAIGLNAINYQSVCCHVVAIVRSVVQSALLFRSFFSRLPDRFPCLFRFFLGCLNSSGTVTIRFLSHLGHNSSPYFFAASFSAYDARHASCD